MEPVVDRLDDAKSQLDEMPDAARKKLFDKVAKELDRQADDQKKAELDALPTIQIVDGMVYVPGGSFVSGAAKTVKETKAYWIDLYPVTNAEYLKFVESTGYRSPKFWTEGRLRDPAAPVVGISWYDAFKYAAFAGKSLATKDQWEKAARGKAGRIFPWGDEFVAENACHAKEDGTDGVEVVGTHPANVSEFGVKDMVGNVWQWTESPDPGDPEQRVICGGSWCDPPKFLRCDEHLSAYPKDKYDNIGFRCVRLAKE
jgi:formylglycine-generating enzyme required for sulfatase activity